MKEQLRLFGYVSHAKRKNHKKSKSNKSTTQRKAYKIMDLVYKTEVENTGKGIKENYSGLDKFKKKKYISTHVTYYGKKV